jgi:hypothetical protein
MFPPYGQWYTLIGRRDLFYLADAVGREQGQ